MSKPQDYSLTQALRPLANETQSLQRRLWILRLLGLLVVAGGWAVTFFILADGNSDRLAGSLLLAALGVTGFAMSITARRVAVNLEKKLRLRLLVHNMELENMATRDDLTQLFNRRYFFDRLQRELEAAKGFDRPLAVILMDVDSLKALNDTHGHTVGDEALASFGQFLLEQTRATDIPARIGGDEFAVILPDTSRHGAFDMMKRFEEGLDGFAVEDGNGASIPLSASFGLAGYPWSAAEVDALMQQVDAAMYTHKLSRREAFPGQEDAQSGSAEARASATPNNRKARAKERLR